MNEPWRFDPWAYTEPVTKIPGMVYVEMTIGGDVISVETDA